MLAVCSLAAVLTRRRPVLIISRILLMSSFRRQSQSVTDQCGTGDRFETIEGKMEGKGFPNLRPRSHSNYLVLFYYILWLVLVLYWYLLLPCCCPVLILVGLFSSSFREFFGKITGFPIPGFTPEGIIFFRKNSAEFARVLRGTYAGLARYLRGSCAGLTRYL